MNFALKSAISRQAKVSKLPLVLWLNEIVGFHPSFSRHGIIQTSLASAHMAERKRSIIEKIPPKGVSFSDLIATFAMPVGFDTCFYLQH